MDHSHLKLFDPAGNETHESHPQSSRQASSFSKPAITYSRVVGEARVAVSVGDLLPLLAEAWSSKRAWLHDFSSDRVIVSQDLYEVLLAYKRMNISKSA